MSTGFLQVTVPVIGVCSLGQQN